jgi:hypothetical protein
VKLIEEGKWGNRQYLPTIALNTLLEKVGLPPVELEMITNSCETRRDWSKFGGKAANRPRVFEIYGLASSKELGHKIEDERLLDIDNAIFIADNYDEEVICLDYRENPPCVLAGLWGKRYAKWYKMAPDFETFARELGLVE